MLAKKKRFVVWLGALMAGSALAGGALADELKVHLNQVALERDGPKVAVVEYSGPTPAMKDGAPGAFTVLKDGAPSLTGALTPLPAFGEWGAGKQYFQADFSGLEMDGTYQLKVAIGGDTATSAPVKVTDDALFATTASALVNYFKLSRHTKPADHKIRVYGTDRVVDVWGGWKDAGGDNGKYLSHLSYANFFNPQQTSFTAWSLAKAHDMAPERFRKAGLEQQLIEEALWGADYLHRLLSPEGYFYMTVFDRWATLGAERVVTGYVGVEGVYTKDYQAAAREGGAVAVAALARAARLSKASGVKGAFPAEQYEADAERAFAHLQTNNRRYVDDGRENIIDDYTLLLAATELFRSTGKPAYLDAARQRAKALEGRLTPEGWFRSDDGDRPFYHGADAGFPVLALGEYLDIEPDAARAASAKAVIARSLAAQLALNAKVANPYDYPRQTFRMSKAGKPVGGRQEGFFMPHVNETGYWWQGESARLASLSYAAVIGGRATDPQAGGTFGVAPDLATFAQANIDWTLGRNPYDLSLLYGFGAKNPPHADSAGDMVVGGISNGITGAADSDSGRGIAFAAGPDEQNWRWIEQWIPHTSWMLLAATAMTQPAGAAPAK
jgi:hypothetical protein